MKLPFFLILTLSTGFAYSAPPKDLVKATLLADVDSVKPGQSFHVGLLLKIEPHWHIYWKNPGDSGAATTANLHLPEGFRADNWQYPLPIRSLESGNVEVFGYEDEVMLISTITPLDNLPAGTPVRLKCDANWLVCEKSCLPGQTTLDLTLPVDAEPKPANGELFARWLKRIPTHAGDRAKVSIEKTVSNANVQWTGTIKLSWHEPPQKVEWFPGVSESLDMTEVQIENESNATLIRFKAESMGDAKKNPAPIDSVVAYTLADGTRLGLSVPISFEKNSSSSVNSHNP